MGLRATSIKKNEVVYGEHQGFNYDAEGLYGIIAQYCDDFYYGGDYPDTNVIWEVDKTEFEDMIETIENLSDEDYVELIGGDRKEVTAFLKGCLADTPRDTTIVSIGWL